MEPTANTPAMTDQERAAAIEQLELQAKELGHSLVSLSAPTVAEKVKEILSLYPSGRSGDTYGTHLNRLVKGFEATCDQACEPCMDAGQDFRCLCSCAKCAKSQISLAPQGDVVVGPTALAAVNVALVSSFARRTAIKHGVLDNRKRATRGLAAKQADGTGAEESAISALRSLCAACSEHLGGANPGLTVKKPRRPGPSRRALADFEMVELYDLTATGGDDIELDTLLFDFGIESGARREGAFNFTVGRIRRAEQILDLIDKYKKTQKAPVSLDLIDRLLEHAIKRGGPQCDPASSSYRPDAPVFWYWNRGAGAYRPVTSRRFDTLNQRWQLGFPWARDLQLSYHFLRHTMSEQLKARYGPHYAKRYLRHADTSVTDTYGQCSTEMLATALSEIFDYVHPLATGRAQERAEVLERHFGPELA